MAEATYPSLIDLMVDASEPKLIDTKRPIEIMFAATGLEPKDLAGKAILNAGSGKTHWGFDLTRRYGIVARDFQNLSLHFARQNLPRQMVGRAFLGEMPANIYRKVPYPDNSFDIVWNSFAPHNLEEFYRVAKDGGSVYILSGEFYDEQHLNLIRQKLPGAEISIRTISPEDTEGFKAKLRSRDQKALFEVEGKQVLVIKKP